ncbi:hypothetical protein ABK040_012989 [Willaertia magna]
MKFAHLAIICALLLVFSSISVIVSRPIKLKKQKHNGIVKAPKANNITLKKYNIAKHTTSVSGISSGGFAAVQFSTAFSASVVGVGVFAGGPFYCAQGQIADAFDQCMYSVLPIDVDGLIQSMQQYASNGQIDPLSNIATQKIYLFSGTNDNTVNPSVMKALYKQYIQLGVPAQSIVSNFSVPAGHAWITDSYGNDCSATMSPWINNCNLNGAMKVLSTIYGNGIAKGSMNNNNLFTFSQSNYTAVDLDSNGYVYIPTACQNNQQCKIHVVLHGCEQGVSYVGEDFVRNTGLNQIAEASNIIVLYPQVKGNMFSMNPNGCWDWFAYSGSNYCTKQGQQMAAVAQMVNALGGDIKL